MTWLLGYLLLGFVIHWCFTQIWHIETNNNWRWELAATICWPAAAICGLVLVIRDRRASPISRPHSNTQEK